MKATKFNNATNFLDKTLAYLEMQESLNSLMLGVAFRLSHRPPRRRNKPFLAVVEDGSELVATAVMTPPHKLILYSHLAECQPALQVLWKVMQDGRWTVPAMLGPANVADRWAALWEKENGRPPKMGRRQRVHELRQVAPISLASGQLRPAHADDFERTVDWIQGFHRDAHIQDDSESATLLARQKIESGELFIWENEVAEPVTMASKVRPTRHGISISLVYTPAPLRGRGYATACVAHLSQQLLDEGYQFCSLFTDLSNPVSNHIYEKIGYTAVADFHEYYFD